MKQRFSALDVSASVADLRENLLGLRLQNVYDINSKTYLFKFNKPDQKELLLIESGIRMHTTQFAREKSTAPSNFAMKLRKHLRTRRLVELKQLGVDRIVDMQFGEGEAAYHVIVEFYASGNIILTDCDYKIMSLLRVVSLEGAPAPKPTDAANDEEIDRTRFAVGEIYNTTLVKHFQPMTMEKLQQSLSKALSPPEPVAPEPEPQQPTAPESSSKKGGKKKGGKQDQPKKEQKKKAHKGKDSTLRKIVRATLGPDYGPSLVDHCLTRSGLDLNAKLTHETPEEEKNRILQALLTAFTEADEIVQSCMTKPQKGWIVLKNLSLMHLSSNNTKAPAPKPVADSSSKPTITEESAEKKDEMVAYDEFHPFLFAQFSNGDHPRQTVEFVSFDKAVDEFFSKLEAQKLELKTRQAEHAAAKKLEVIRAGHENQLQGLENVKAENVRAAEAIESNPYEVEAVIHAVRQLIASGIDWVDLEEIIKEERRRRNPVAMSIVGLKLDVAMVTVALKNPDYVSEDEADDDSDESDDDSSDDDDDEDKQSKRKGKNDHGVDRTINVDIDIYSSAFANARRYYETKKTAAVKQEKTLKAAEKAIKSAERKIAADLKATQQNTATITKIRKPFWFEKFFWFISSENYLVVGGRDAGQNEMLVRRYLNKNDIYVHADLHGAASVIIKNPYSLGQAVDGLSVPPPSPDGCPVPPTTLLQAGTMSVCASKAWDAKIVTSAWWVYENQVSKTAPTGEYLTTGSFMIRGKKNWLPPVQLIYGFGLLFKIDES
ncbi:hypothetical protein HK102_012770, partial [Quaeritorhiza haematococci]